MSDYIDTPKVNKNRKMHIIRKSMLVSYEAKKNNKTKINRGGV